MEEEAPETQKTRQLNCRALTEARFTAQALPRTAQADGLLVPEQRQQNDDGNGNSQQPEQDAASHIDLLNSPLGRRTPGSAAGSAIADSVR